MAMTAATETLAESASSLRARALSTLKSKRRKVAAVQPTVPIFPRPLPPAPELAAMQLDYGEDEPSLESTTRMDVDPPAEQDSRMREEGEISDEEGASKRPSANAAAQPPVELSMSPATASPTSTSPTNTSPTSTLPITTGLSLLDRITNPPKVLPSAKPLSERISSPLTVSTSSRSIHAHQVRPNVPMDQSNYDTAKDLLLELLGWGVEPEYLVKSGLTRELIFYAFTELNLRLPTNLDTRGLAPYNPDTVKSFSFIEPDPSSAGTTMEASPLRANILDARTSSQDDQVAAAPKVDPLDIEKLRRQELMARKAVQASRRAKKATTNPIPSSTVDDFLNSIVPVAEVAAPSADPPTPPLVETQNERFTLTPSPPSFPQQEEKTGSSSPPLEAPPSSTDSVAVSFDNALRLSPETSSGGTTTPVNQHPKPSRRGVKRPVASDFVDWDAGSRPLGRSHSYDANTNPTIAHQHIRRKTGGPSFVHNSIRNCIIDLSDSETDEDDESRSPMTSKVVAFPRNGKTKSSFKPPPQSAPPTGTSTPTMLEEKEREIQRMKQLIAERMRQAQLKKLGGAKAGADILTLSPHPKSPSPDPSPSDSRVASADSDNQVPGQPIQDQITEEQHTKLEPMTSAQHDQELSPSSGSVDVDIAMSPSAQVAPTPTAPYAQEMTGRRHESFMPDSFFASYPLLRLSLQTTLAGVSSSPKDCPPSSFPDLRPLREATLIKSIDPSKFLCQYEVPGGGVCRDANCNDVHLSRLDGGLASVEPNDQDTAKFLCRACDGLSFDLVFSTLQQERLNNPNASLEELAVLTLTSQHSSLPEPPPTT